MLRSGVLVGLWWGLLLGLWIHGRVCSGKSMPHCGRRAGGGRQKREKEGKRRGEGLGWPETDVLNEFHDIHNGPRHCGTVGKRFYAHGVDRVVDPEAAYQAAESDKHPAGDESDEHGGPGLDRVGACADRDHAAQHAVAQNRQAPLPAVLGHFPADTARSEHVAEDMNRVQRRIARTSTGMGTG